MDGNKEDARRCLQLAADAFSNGNIERATRLLSKSRRMYPLPEIQDALQERISQFKHKSQPSSTSSHQHSHSNTDSVTPNNNNDSQAPEREPTADMVAAVSAIQKSKNKSHYDVLAVSRDATPDQIKKAYKKLALRLHPDRNYAPGSDEAFKRVGQAFMILSDPSKRSHYDYTGQDDTDQPVLRQRRRRNSSGVRFTGFPGHFSTHGEMTPEELFEFVFANGTGAENIFREARRTETIPEDTLFGRIRPILVLFAVFFIISLFSQNSGSSRLSLNPTYYHQKQLQTRNGIDYYVSQNLRIPSSSFQRQLEYQADRMAYAELQEACATEQEYRNKLRRRSNSLFSSSSTRQKYKEAYEKFRGPACEKMAWLHARLSA